MELGHEHRAESQPPTVDAFQDEANEAIQSTDAGQNAAPIQDRQNEAAALSRRELDGESMAEHDRAHDYQESCHEFLVLNKVGPNEIGMVRTKQLACCVLKYQERPVRTWMKSGSVTATNAYVLTADNSTSRWLAFSAEL